MRIHDSSLSATEPKLHQLTGSRQRRRGTSGAAPSVFRPNNRNPPRPLACGSFADGGFVTVAERPPQPPRISDLLNHPGPSASPGRDSTSRPKPGNGGQGTNARFLSGQEPQPPASRNVRTFRRGGLESDLLN